MPADQPDYTSVIARPGIAAAGSPFALVIGATAQTITLQSDTHALGVVFTNAANITRLQVVGVQSNAVYLDVNVSLQSPTGVIWVPLQAASDTSVTVTIQSTVTGHVYISLIADPSAVGVFTPVLPPWQAPNQAPLQVDTGNLVANAVNVILPALTNVRYYLHTLHLCVLAGNANWILQDTTPTGLGSFTLFNVGAPNNLIVPPLPPYDFRGTPLTKGKGFQLQNTSAGTVRYIGMLTYSQSTS